MKNGNFLVYMWIGSTVLNLGFWIWMFYTVHKNNRDNLHTRSVLLTLGRRLSLNEEIKILAEKQAEEAKK